MLCAVVGVLLLTACSRVGADSRNSLDLQQAAYISQITEALLQDITSMDEAEARQYEEDLLEFGENGLASGVTAWLGVMKDTGAFVGVLSSETELSEDKGFVSTIQAQFENRNAEFKVSYMALVPIIQPPIMKFMTTEAERKIKMDQLRPVSKLEKILFPIIVTVVVCLILPTTAPLVGMLMLGNLFRESGVVKQLSDTVSNAMMYIVVILLGTSVGASTSAEAFLKVTTLKIVALGLIAFAFGTAAGVLFGKVMCKLTGGKVNPLIGSAGVSAVPMAARVAQKVGSEADPTNFLLMHAMGPNVAGVIGTAVAAGTFMAIFGVK